VTEAEAVVQAQFRIIAALQKLVRDLLQSALAALPLSAQELNPQADPEAEPDVTSEVRRVGECVIVDCLNSAITDLSDAAEYQPDPSQGNSPSIAHLDLSVFSEATQRELYEVVVADNFRDTEPDAGEGAVPQYTPEQAGLEVVWAWGRWFATWLKLELPDTLPEAERREILVLEENRHRPGTLGYGEV
jgi:hypothetical protein